MSFVEAIERATPTQLKARAEYIERRKRLGGVVERPKPVLRVVRPEPDPEPEPAPVANPRAVMVVAVDITTASPIILTEVPIPLRKSAAFDHIKHAVCTRYGIARADLISKSRFKKFVQPRQIAMYLCREMTNCSMPQIGRRFGNKDHTTVLYSYRKVATMIEQDPAFAGEVAEIRNSVRG